jgi:hypothetical protein
MLQAQQQCQNPKITLLSIAQAGISVNCQYASYNCKLHELSTIPPSITALVCLAVMAWKNISKHTAWHYMPTTWEMKSGHSDSMPLTTANGIETYFALNTGAF